MAACVALRKSGRFCRVGCVCVCVCVGKAVGCSECSFLQMPSCIHRWQRQNGSDTSTTQTLLVHEIRGIRECRGYADRLRCATATIGGAITPGEAKFILGAMVLLRAVTALKDYLAGWFIGRNRTTPRVTQEIMTTQITIWKDSLALDFFAAFPYERLLTSTGRCRGMVEPVGHAPRCTGVAAQLL